MSLSDVKLIDDFVATFSTWDVTSAFEANYSNEQSSSHWIYKRVLTNKIALEKIYEYLPAKLPLYEKLVLTYRWARVDLNIFRLLENPIGEYLEGLLKGIFKDKNLSQVLLSNGLIQFGFAPGINYDPVCFDTKRKTKNGDYPVVQLDHEEILCNSRLRKVKELAPGFRDLVLQVIKLANV